MACYKYFIVNNGPNTLEGTVKYCGSGIDNFWACPGYSHIELACAEENSIRYSDALYAAQYATAQIIGSDCNVVENPECDLVITSVDVTPTDKYTDPLGRNGTATINHTGTGAVEFSVDGLNWQDSNHFTGLSANEFRRGGSILGYIASVRRKDDTTCKASKSFTIPAGPAPLFVNVSKKVSPTTVGGSDGSITVTVITGSGNYTVEFTNYDEVIHNLDAGMSFQSMDKTGLPAGDYDILVTDLANGATQTLSATLVDPAAPAPEKEFGDYLYVPILNSLHFVVEDLNVPQAFDNRLLINQSYPGFEATCYKQKVCKDDFIVTQFHTNYRNFVVELYDYVTNEKVKIFPSPTLREANIGATDDFAIRIQPHTETGKCRVYFTAGEPPIPVEVGIPFEILNSPDGFNGVYNPADIEFDELFGYSYVVITKSWELSSTISSVNATGRFSVSTDDFDIYEVPHTFLEISNGTYYIKITAFDEGSSKMAVSEPIDLQVEHKGTNIIRYRNIDNAFGLAFSHGYVGILRVPSLIGHKRITGGERTTSRNADYSLTKVSARKTRGFMFETFMLPPYLHEKLSVVFDCDEWSINNVACQSSEPYAEPSFLYKSLLANSSILVEQVNWFDKYNSDDIGSVADGGFILRDSSGAYIKR